MEKFLELFTSIDPSLSALIPELFSPCILDQENAQLCSIPEEEEILCALNSMSPLKAPSLDGIPPLFYQKYWNVVREADIFEVQQFFTQVACCQS